MSDRDREELKKTAANNIVLVRWHAAQLGGGDPVLERELKVITDVHEQLITELFNEQMETQR